MSNSILSNFHSEIALCVPYVLKDKVDLRNCRWNHHNKLWYYVDTRFSGYGDDDAECEILNKYELVYLLDIKFNDKEYIKKNGGCWNNDKKTWYTYKSNDILTKKYKYETVRERTHKEDVIYYKEQELIEPVRQKIILKSFKKVDRILNDIELYLNEIK
jgi:hypothetical protein